MPASLTHLMVGQKALACMAPENLPQYWLGCVVPDAPNLDGFASKEERWHFHLRDRELTQWMENIVAFRREQAKAVERSYLLGYIVHTVADVVWDELFEKRLDQAIQGQKLTKEERFRSRWSEHYRYEREQRTADWWLKGVAPQLRLAIPQEINGMEMKLVERWRDYLVEDYNPVANTATVGFVTAEIVEEFGERVAERLKSRNLC